jgi:hypothetical protein
VELSNSPEAVLKAIKLNQGHILISGLFQNMDVLHLTVLLEDAPEDLLPANLLLEGGDMEGLGGSVDGDGLVGCEAGLGEGYRS